MAEVTAIIVSTTFLNGHMDTTLLNAPTSRRHRRHSDEFKAQAIEACLQPGVSIAAVALANQLNANMLRSWVKAHRDQQGTAILGNDSADLGRAMTDCHPTTLVPVAIEVADAKGSKVAPVFETAV